MLDAKRIAEIRRRSYEVLELGAQGDRLSMIVSRTIMTLIVVNLISAALESVPELNGRYGRIFLAIELVSLVVFTIEYVMRVWVAVEHAPYSHLAARRARMRYALSPAGIVDLVAVLPFWVALIWPFDLRALLIFRIVRFLKLARYSTGMRTLIDVLIRERRALFGAFVIMLGAALVVATAVYYAERDAQPDKFGTIPDAMWWAIVTLATVGYGDVVPVTPFGKLLTSIAIFFGVTLVALPIGIIATAFAEEIHRRDFVVTWSMIARVPVFNELNAAEIADIMRLLRAQTVGPGEVIVRRGEPGHSMYFVAAGEVEIELKEGNVRLGVGDFFGEVAVLRRTRRTATVRATTRTNLLVLDADDLHALMDANPNLAKRMHEVMNHRIGGKPLHDDGDIAEEELADAKPASDEAPQRSPRRGRKR
jgi:voltage-gated potassium channel